MHLNFAMTVPFHILSNYYSLIMLYRLDGLEFESSCGARFSTVIQTGPGAHPAYHTMGTRSLSGDVKQPGRCTNRPPPSSVEIKQRVELYLSSSSGPSWPDLE
jgi:hypothetical protein